MEAVYYNRKGGMHYSLSFIAMLILLLLNANSCSGGAAVGIQLVKSNTTFGCNGRLEECLIMEDVLELEFLMNPYISRILVPDNNGGTGASKDKNKAYPCGKPGDPYANCIAPAGGKAKNKENCSQYQRGKC
ncbi:hypothetical protein I3842_04G054300 [Carya illinoinensis]|uniref:Rapid ALkalinization Factor n=1 Tax=Carya illinoinensis TaxID=32201 RepID=A0A922FAR4_CARIL|nr:hypothetical protein I3842_04G054300 [Carya illinoinensis]